MAYTPPQPPYVDGICTFVDNDPVCMAVQKQLATIRAGFQPSATQQAVDAFYIVSTYNKTVAGTPIDATNGNYPVINGDTAEHCLSLYDQAQQTQPSGM